MSDINLDKWDFNVVKNGNLFAMLIIGSRRSGKSNMVKFMFKLAKFTKYYDYFLVFCNSGEVRDFYAEFVPGSLFFDDFNEEYFQRVFKMSEEYRIKGTPKKFLAIFDDSVGSDEKLSDSIMQIYNTGRHHNISIIFCSQRLFLTNTSARNNSDAVLIGKSKSSGEKKYIIETFLNGLLDDEEIPKGRREKQMYNSIIKKYTVDYNFLVLDFSNDQSNAFYDTVFYFKAPNMH